LSNIYFSIVTVCYNSEDTISKTIQSVLNQKYSNYEYIIIDGKSNDRTLEIIKSFKEKFTDLKINFKYLSEPDNGLYEAMNKGIKMSSGQYVGLLNSDDWYNNDTLALLNNIINSSGFANIYHGNLIHHDGLSSKIIKPNTSMLKMDYMGMSYLHPTFFVEANIYNRLAYDSNYSLLADFKFVYEALTKEYNFCYYDSALVNMLGGGASDNNFIMRIIEGYNIRRDLGFSFLKTLTSTMVRVMVTIVVKFKAIIGR
jgi:glycosyltransferase involved in cell wall biosynthesis